MPRPGLDPVWHAMSKLRRRRFDDCIKLCSEVLEENPYDQVRPLIPKTRWLPFEVKTSPNLNHSCLCI